MAATLSEALRKVQDGPEFTGLRLLGKGAAGVEEDSRPPTGQEDSFVVVTLETPLTIVDMEELVQAVSKAPQLTTLELCNHGQISDAIWKTFSKILASDPPLKSLALRKCGIVDKVFQNMVMFLKMSTHLTELDMSGNHLKSSFFSDDFGKHFAKSPTLHTLNFSNNQLNMLSMLSLTDAMADSPVESEKITIVHGNLVVEQCAKNVAAGKNKWHAPFFQEQEAQVAAGMLVASKLKPLAPPRHPTQEEKDLAALQEALSASPRTGPLPVRSDARGTAPAASIAPIAKVRTEFMRQVRPDPDDAVTAPTLLQRQDRDPDRACMERHFQKYRRPGVSFSAEEPKSPSTEAPEFSLQVEPLGPSHLQIELRCFAGPDWTPFAGQVEVPCCMSLGQIRTVLATHVGQRPCFRRKDVKFMLPCGKEL